MLACQRIVLRPGKSFQAEWIAGYNLSFGNSRRVHAPLAQPLLVLRANRCLLRNRVRLIPARRCIDELEIKAARRSSRYHEIRVIEMPFLFHVDESTRVFHVQAIGEVNDVELMDLSGRLQQEVAFVSEYPILCDCSALTAVLISSSLIESLAKAARSRKNFVAVIAPRAVAFGLARMYQIFSDPEDARIHVFARAKEARAWLDTVGKGLTLHA